MRNKRIIAIIFKIAKKYKQNPKQYYLNSRLTTHDLSKKKNDAET